MTEQTKWPSEAMDKVRSTLFPGAGGTDSESADGIPWWMKYLCKTAAILAASGISDKKLTSRKQWMNYFQHRCFSARGTASRSPQCVWSPECGRSRPASLWSWLRPPSAACVWILSLHSQRWRKKGRLGRKLSFILCKFWWDITGKLLLLTWSNWS